MPKPLPPPKSSFSVEDECELDQHPESGLEVRQRRDTAAFSEFVETRSHALLRTAYLMVGDHQLAQDLPARGPHQDPHRLAQAARPREGRCLRAEDGRDDRHHLAPATLVPRTSGRTDAEVSGVDQVDALATHQVLVTQLRQLSPRQRAAIVLRYYEDLTESQTAEIMGCSVGAVKSHVSVGLSRLRERMGPALDMVPTGEEGVS